MTSTGAPSSLLFGWRSKEKALAWKATPSSSSTSTTTDKQSDHGSKSSKSSKKNKKKKMHSGYLHATASTRAPSSSSLGLAGLYASNLSDSISISEDNSFNHQSNEDSDSDDDKSVQSALTIASTSSARSTFSIAASTGLINTAKLLKKTAAMPVVATKTVARKSFQAGAAVVQGTSHAVVSGTTAVVGGTTAVVKGGSKALYTGTTAVVGGTSKALYTGTSAVVGGTTAVVKGGSKALYTGTTAVVGGTSKALYTGTTAVVGGTTAVVKGGSKALYTGTSAVVKGSSKALYTGTTAMVGGTTAVVKGSSKVLIGGTSAVTKKTVKSLQRVSHLRHSGRDGFRSGRRYSNRSNSSSAAASATGGGGGHHQNQWDADMEVLQEILQPGSAIYRALSASQRKSLQRVKKTLLHQGQGEGILSSPGAGGGAKAAAAFLPIDLVQMEKRNQKRIMMQRRYSNTSSVGNHSSASDLRHDGAASVQSEASYILQEYGGIRNPTALLFASQSQEFEDEDDLFDATSTSDLSNSESREDLHLLMTPISERISFASTLLTVDNDNNAEGSLGINDVLFGNETPSPTSTVISQPVPPPEGDTTDNTSDMIAASFSKLEDSMDLKSATKSASGSSSVLDTHSLDKKATTTTTKKKKKSLLNASPRLPPPVVTITLTANTTQKDATYMNTLPIEFEQLGGLEQQRIVYNMLRWERLSQWDYDNIFDLDRYTCGNALLFMGWSIIGAPYAQYAMAHACGLATEDDVYKGYPFMDKLFIPPQKLIQYLRVIQEDYHAENPYHNAIHAADVLQTVHAMIQMALMEKISIPDVDGGEPQDESRDTAGFFFKSCPNHLKLFSILLAAVVHDVDHPGRNNAFHTKLRTELAVIYNDKSVLENWHIAHAFSRMLGLDLFQRSELHKNDHIICNDPSPNKSRDCDCNLLCNTTADDFSAIRNMMIEAILNTDMTKHFAVVTEAKRMFLQIMDDESSNTIRHDDERTWTLLMYMLHQADISGQAKADPLFLNWSDRCMQEFFAQGDQEAALGMFPISPFCDRNTTSHAVSQTGFVEFVVLPSFQVLGDYIPGIQQLVLPIIQENLEFWYDASGKKLESETDDQDEEQPESNKKTLENVEEEGTTTNDEDDAV